MRSYAVLAGAVLAGCAGAVTLDVTGDRPIPTALDSICVGIADDSSRGGQFGRAYRLEGKLGSLPQTLRAEPGGASSAHAWVRGDRGGVPVQLAAAHVDFHSEVHLPLDVCARGPATLPHAIGAAVGPSGAHLAASVGAGGLDVVAVTPGGAAQIAVHGGALASLALPVPLPGGTKQIVAVVALDADGDCDDDVIVATDAAPPELWKRDHGTFVDSGVAIGSAPASAVAVADVDRDGNQDVVLGFASGALELWRNDGAGNFTPDRSAFGGPARVTNVTALALADLDGDGNPDLVVGQGNGGPLEAWLGDPGGTGSFVANDALVPALPLVVERLVLVDSDGDFQPDLAVMVKGAAMHLLIDRAGRLEEQSFVRLPQPAPTAHAIALADWDDACGPDAVIASDAGTPTWRGGPGGVFAAETSTPPAATDVVFADVDGDGELDAIYATAQGVQWLAR